MLKKLQKLLKRKWRKINIKTGDALGGLDNLSLDNQSKKAPDVMMAPYDRVGGLGSDGQLAEVTLNKDSHTDKTTEALVTNGGKVYGAPAVIETLVLYYNKDLLKEAPKHLVILKILQKIANTTSLANLVKQLPS